MSAWLAEALDNSRVRKLRHQGNHRYVFTTGTRSQRRLTVVDGSAQPYPKNPDQDQDLLAA